MALADEVQNRFKTEHLVHLTNPNDRTASTVNTTLLGLAVTDVQADFEIHAETEYDGTDANHVSIAVQGVIAKLLMYSESGAAGGTEEDAHERFLDRLRKLKTIGPRTRISPTTDSPLTPSAEQIGTETVRPWSDRGKFTHLAPGSEASDDPFASD